MKKNFDIADHLWLESFRSLTKNGGTKSFDGYTARLTDVDKCFTWNNGLQMDALKACSKLLFLLDFSYDGAFIKAYDHFAEVDRKCLWPGVARPIIHSDSFFKDRFLC